jgi:hypothetical protein
MVGRPTYFATERFRAHFSHVVLQIKVLPLAFPSPLPPHVIHRFNTRCNLACTMIIIDHATHAMQSPLRLKTWD